MNLDFSFLKKLCEANGASGAEEPVKKIFLEAAKDLVDDVWEDELGNLILHKRGKGPRVLLDAHLDEVAFLVAGFEGPFLRILPLGGVDSRMLYGQRLIIWGRRPLSAVVVTTPPHLGEKEKQIPPVEEMLLDVGLSEERVRELVSIGDPVTFPPFFEENEEAIWGKALDDRVGLFLMVEALKGARTELDLYLSTTVQEEVGLRGAQALAQKIKPEIVLVLEGTLAGDLPGTPAHLRLALCGKGPELRLADARFLADRNLTLGLASLARKRAIPHQVVVKNRGGTNAAAFQVGVPVRAAAISVPVRYLHSSVSLAFKGDITAALNLLKAFLENPEEVLSYRWTYPGCEDLKLANQVEKS